jgi:phytol kinase
LDVGAANIDWGAAPADLARSIPLALMVLGVVYATKPFYHYMRGRGLPHNVAVYYNRKTIHAAGGGLVALLVPYIFREPLIPALMAFLLGGFLWYMRHSGRLMYWFQVPENSYEVNFTLAWGTSLLILWPLLGSARLAVIPALFIAFGDAVTGVVRNTLFARRTKHWAGNIAMLAVTAPLGYIYGSLPGLFAGIIASFVERYGFPPIDDNILIALSSLAVLLAAPLL